MTKLRLIQLSNYIKERGNCTVAELKDAFNISHATIHRDIATLVEQGEFKRARGGVAVIPPEESGNAEYAVYARYQDRLDRNRDAKVTIAQKAVQRIADGDIVFLDSSTTVYYMAKELQKNKFSNLTIITNSLLIIREFSLFPTRYFLVALGGNYDVQLNAFLGAATQSELERLKIGKAFISALGATQEGFFSRHENHSYFLRRVLEIADDSYLLLTSDKFGKSGLFDIGKMSCLSGVIAESEMPEYIPSELR
ncbi:MAG: DeoR/GlpR family DNA-binding transcription regulator [Victivallales bacterium]|jgi:DeoR/GlpR family transcriptional regulator of sugar metabolism|nr:DeoR/GlpR family DNA-binding transcription regulator [Victivallales bacterium]